MLWCHQLTINFIWFHHMNSNFKEKNQLSWLDSHFYFIFILFYYSRRRQCAHLHHRHLRPNPLLINGLMTSPSTLLMNSSIGGWGRPSSTGYSTIPVEEGPAAASQSILFCTMSAAGRHRHRQWWNPTAKPVELMEELSIGGVILLLKRVEVELIRMCYQVAHLF